MTDLNLKKDEIQTSALAEIVKYKRATAVMSMGSGKTRLGLLHMMYYLHDQSKYLVVAPKRSIFDSWKTDAINFGYEELLNHITFTTYLSLNKQDVDYDCIYLDEVHSLLDTHISYLDSYYGRIVGLTGTPPKRGEKASIVYKYCPVKFVYKTDTAVSDKILNDYEIHVHLLPLSVKKDIPKKKGNSVWYASESQMYNYWNNQLKDAATDKQSKFLRIMRMRALMEFTSKEKYAAKLFEESKHKCILFANTQEQADKMCKHSYHSKNSKSEENLQNFKEGKITRLSCVLQLNEGVNIPNLKEGIIMHAYGNERKSAQRIGRLLRLNPDDKSIVHILCYENTVDETWVKEALSDLDQNKITWKHANQLQLDL